MPKVGLSTLESLATRALERAGASPTMASSTARALVLAEAQGLASHGVSRVRQYAAHLRLGRADGRAVARVVRERGGAALVDAGGGLAFAACALAVDEAIRRARVHGVSFVGVCNSHHFGAAAGHLQPVAEAGMVGLAFGNSPAVMPAAGGRWPLFGADPIAAVFPRASGAPLIVDLPLAEPAPGGLPIHAETGRPSAGRVIDRDGDPSGDSAPGTEPRTSPVGGTQGAMLALVVELLACALTGAAFGFEADSLFVDGGNRPRLGQAFLAIEPEAIAGRDVYLERVESLVSEMSADPGGRLPGYRRYALAERAAHGGIEIEQPLLDELAGLAGPGRAEPPR